MFEKFLEHVSILQLYLFAFTLCIKVLPIEPASNEIVKVWLGVIIFHNFAL